MKQPITILRIAAGCALVAIEVLGAFGMSDNHQAKLPITAIAVILGVTYFHKEGWDD